MNEQRYTVEFHEDARQGDYELDAFEAGGDTSALNAALAKYGRPGCGGFTLYSLAGRAIYHPSMAAPCIRLHDVAFVSGPRRMFEPPYEHLPYVIARDRFRAGSKTRVEREERERLERSTNPRPTPPARSLVTIAEAAVRWLA